MVSPVVFKVQKDLPYGRFVFLKGGNGIRSVIGLGKIWQLPTLPRLKPKYHWRRKVSRPSSEWDRVGPFRNSHQIISNPVEVFY